MAIAQCVRLNDSGIDAIINEATTLERRWRERQAALRDGSFADQAALDAAIAARDAANDKLMRYVVENVDRAHKASASGIAALRAAIPKLVIFLSFDVKHC